MKFSVAFDSEQKWAGFGRIWGRSAQYLHLLSSHEANSNWRLLVGFEFGLDEEGSCVNLSFPPGGFVVSIDGVGGVIEHDEGSF